MNMIAIDDELL